MASATELDAQWEAQYLVVKQKNDERLAALRTLAADPVYQNASPTEQSRLLQASPAETKRLEFNAENQKLTAIKKELDLAIAKEKETSKSSVNDAQGRAVPNETQTGGGLSVAEQSRLQSAGDPNAGATAAFVPYRNLVTQAAGKDDKNIPQEKARAAATSKGNLFGTAGPIEGTFFPGVNPLHNYATYNYNISLHALSGEEYNAVMTGSFNPSNPLMHTAGGYRPRNQYFEQDFFIDGLEIISVIGATEDGNGSKNEVYYTFKIIEPMGMTLMNRLVSLGETLFSGGSDKPTPWPEIPYCMVIEFTGFYDDGTPVALHEHRKLYPMKIVNIDILPSLKGTEYQCKAIPYNHLAFTKEFGTLPSAVECEAKTLEDAFRENEKAGVNKDGRPIATTEVLGGEKEKKYKVKSIVSAYNNFQTGLVKNKAQDVPDKMLVKFADEILKDMDVVPPDTQPADRAASPDRERKQLSGKQATGTDPGGPKPTVGVFSFNSGDYIETIIDTMMQQSKYWRKQISVFTKDKEKPVNAAGETLAWKIIPYLKMLKYDKQRGRPGYEVTFFVKVHVKYNRQDPNMSKAWPKNVARIYEYSYSGRNTDVLTWEVKFNTAYTQTELVYPEKNTAVSGANASLDTTDKLEASKAAIIGRSVAESGGGAGEGPNNEVNPRRISKISSSASATGANANKDGLSMVAANSYDGIYNKLAELNKVELTIVGDPAWLINEDVSQSPEATLNVPSKEYDGGGGGDSAQVLFNQGDVHVRLLWRTVTDLDEQTGGYGSNSGFVQPVLNGVYQVQMVKSFFTNGVFTQQLVCVRLLEQEEKEFGAVSQSLGLSERDITQFPSFQPANALTAQTQIRSEYKESTPAFNLNPRISVVDTGFPSDGLRESQASFQTFGLQSQGGQAAFGQRYDIPTSIPNPLVDPFNLPTGVTIDPATGLPNYKNNFYTGGQKDIAAWKQAVDEKQPFSYTSTRPNGNANITRYPGT
jgi:hypothetical protein